MLSNVRLLIVSVLVPSLCVMFAQSVALAEPIEQAVLVRYEAAGDCPQASAFMNHFASRTTRVRLTSSLRSAQHSFAVVLTHDADRVVGRLDIASRDGIVSHREVVGQSCAEVVPALAFVAALAADPTAQPNAVTTSLAPNGAAMGSLLPGQSQAPAARRSGIASERQTESPAILLPERRHRGQAAIGHWALLGQSGVVEGLFPDSSVYATMVLQLELPEQRWGTSGLELGVIGALSGSHQVNPGSAHFQWLAAELGACPTTLRFSDRWSITPCAIGELGMLRGVLRGVTAPGSETRLWRAVGASAQLKWVVVGRFFLQAAAVLRCPLARDEFGVTVDGVFKPIHRVGKTFGSVGIGIGIGL